MSRTSSWGIMARNAPLTPSSRNTVSPNDPALVLLARIVNGADTDNSLHHRPEGPGLNAIAEGFRHLGLKDDHAINAAEWIVYDALYAYCQAMIEARKGPMVHSHRNVILLFTARSIRLFAYGALSVVLALYLHEAGLSSADIGLLFTLTLSGDAGITLWITTTADRIGRKKMLLLGAGLMVMAGVVFSLTGDIILLMIAAIIGVISPSGNEIGPFFSAATTRSDDSALGWTRFRAQAARGGVPAGDLGARRRGARVP